ncbi:hypothetical protein ABIB25_001602 [Nakamurella sp. UYEF19]|uniref:hypothetical protein n=1 Tax=Nakamurella sp. UYEF19 TaxID=1756392 RepID=UPI0033945237
MTPRPPLVSEALFVPVTPCRIADTRKGGGFMANNASRAFYVTGTTGFAPQGGKSGGCRIPTGATGVTANVTAAGTVSDGYLTGYPTGSIAPITNFITTHRNFNLTANPTFALAAGNARPLTIANHGGNTHVVVDVTGYYIPQLEGLVNIAGATYAGTSRMLGATQLGTGSYRVQWDTDVANCAPMVTVYGGLPGYATSQNLNTVYTIIRTYSPAGTPTDFATQVSVSC